MNDMTNIDHSAADVLGLTSDIVTAFVSNNHNHIGAEAIPGLITATHGALMALMTAGSAAGAPAVEAKQEPAVSIRASVKNDFLVCLEDGKKVKMLKRYLRTNYDLTPEQYRAKWNLPRDYPMVAPDYAEKRRELAKSIGLGTKGRQSAKVIETIAEVTGSDAKTVASEAKGETAPKADAAPAKAPRKNAAKPKAIKAAPVADAPKAKRGRPAKAQQEAVAA